MIKYLFLLLALFLVAILQISFLPALHIYGGIINLPIVILSYNLYLGNSARKDFKVLVVACSLGLLIDLLSGGYFLSATISLLLLAIILENLKKIILFDGSNPLILIPVFLGTIFFDVVYLVLNRVLFLNPALILPMLFDALFTSLLFLATLIIVQRFKGRQHHEIKLQ